MRHLSHAILCLGLVALTACGPASTKCTRDADCTGGQVCVASACVAPDVDGGGGGGTGGAGGGTGGGSGGGSGGGGNPVVTVTPGESCQMPGVLAAGSDGTATSTLTGAADDHAIPSGSGCAGARGTGGLEKVVQVEVPAGQRLIAVATPTTDFDVLVNVIEAPAANCGQPPVDGGAANVTCLASEDSNANGTGADFSESVVWANTDAAPKTVFVVVENWDDTAGDFTLDIKVLPPPAGDVCATAAAAITATTSVANESLLSYGDDYNTQTVDTGCRFASGPDRVYAILIPPGQRLTATVTPDGNSGDLSLNLVEGPAANCAASPVVCVAAADRGFTGGAETVTLDNTAAAAKEVLLIVDRFQGAPGPGETYALSVNLGPVPAGDICASAAAVTPGTPLTGQMLAGFQDDYSSGPGCAFGSLENDRVYKVTVPSGQQVTATVTVDGMAGADGGTVFPFDTSVNLVVGQTNCTPSLTCAAGNNAARGQPDVATWANFGGGSQDVFVVVDTSSTNVAGTFSLDVALSAAVLPAAGDACESAGAAITANTTRAAETLSGFTNRYTSSSQVACEYGPGPDRAYAIDLPAGQRVQIQTTGNALPDGGTVNVGLSLLDATTQCSSGPCLAGSDSFSNPVEKAGLSNGSNATRQLLLVVDGQSSTAVGSYDLSVVFSSIPAGELCTQPTAIAAAGTLPTESLANFVKDYPVRTGGQCRSAFGPDAVYSMMVPAGQTLTVTVTPDSGSDIVINLFSGPAATCLSNMCLASSDRALRGGVESVTHQNLGATPQEVFIVVADYYSASATAVTYSLVTALQ